MKKSIVIAAALVAIIILSIGIFSFFNFPKLGFECKSLQAGEWQPQKGECQKQDMQEKCNEFCSKHQDCCPGWQNQSYGANPYGSYNESSGFGGRQEILPLPTAEDISKLTRNYPAVIKSINEGPMQYGNENIRTTIISDKTFSKMKDTGFNNIQFLLIASQEGDKYAADESSLNVLLNNIVNAKKNGLSVWVAFEYLNAPPGSGKKMAEYESFKPAYLNFCKEIGELLEKYKAEYVTVNNEPDLFFQEQVQWGTKEEIEDKVAEMLPLANSAVKETFSGKVINKITKTMARPQKILDASFKNADIAGVDVGPYVGQNLPIENYAKEFGEYQFYASLAEKAGVPWMNAEYWQYNFFEEPNDYVKAHQAELAKASFDAYLKAKPKGAGYTWNDFTTFSLLHGEETRVALKEFLGKI